MNALTILRPLSVLGLALLLAACGRPYVSCTSDEARALLADTFKQEVARVIAQNYGDVSEQGRKATDPIAAEFAGLRETAKDTDTCKGEAVVTVKLDPAVARRLADPTAAIYLPSELGDTKIVGNELRGSVKYALVAGVGGGELPRVDAASMNELAAAAVVFTMQLVSERAARDEAL